jgi:hypothetical protein
MVGTATRASQLSLEIRQITSQHIFLLSQSQTFFMMTANTNTKSTLQSSLEHLSKPSAAWETVAARQLELEPLLDRVYNLPIEEFRKIPYKVPPLPANVPLQDRDLSIREDNVTVRDGTQINIRIYEPLDRSTGHLLFFNVHGGGGILLNLSELRSS